jgi:N-acetylmuramic acid 6-phosphate etherase
MDNYLSGLTTEEINKDTQNIDESNTEEMLLLINEQDSLIPEAVKKQIPNITLAVDIIYKSLKNGGRMFYIGAGTSGRMGVLDASECPPTFGTNPEIVQAYIAGGDRALRISSEGCEDDGEAGAKLVHDCKITNKDVVVGITASGGAAFVIAAIKESKELGAATIGLVNNKSSKLSKVCDVCIAPIVGAEAIIGSTRMKSGTAQKLVLNMLTTCTMIKLGKVYGNLMVDLRATNKKLYERARHIVCLATGVDDTIALKYLELANLNAKLAIMMIKTGLNVNEAKTLLENHDGMLKDSINVALNYNQ